MIFITGADNEAARKAALEAGCVAYLPKPFSSDVLIEAIEKIGRCKIACVRAKSKRQADDRPRT